MKKGTLIGIEFALTLASTAGLILAPSHIVVYFVIWFTLNIIAMIITGVAMK